MSMQVGLVGLSTVFLVGAVVLAVLICRLKGVNPCVIAKDYLFYSKKYGLSGSEPFSYGSTSKPTVSKELFESEEGESDVCRSVCIRLSFNHVDRCRLRLAVQVSDGRMKRRREECP